MAVDWRNKTWEPGDRVEYHVGRGKRPSLEITPGLYWYSGWGSGELFLTDGTFLWCSPSEAQAECQKQGLRYHFVDSFITGTFVSVQD